MMHINDFPDQVISYKFKLHYGKSLKIHHFLFDYLYTWLTVKWAHVVKCFLSSVHQPLTFTFSISLLKLQGQFNWNFAYMIPAVVSHSILIWRPYWKCQFCQLHSRFCMNYFEIWYATVIGNWYNICCVFLHFSFIKLWPLTFLFTVF